MSPTKLKAKKGKSPGGRDPLDLNAKQIGLLAGMNLTMEEIGAVVGCSVDTLERRFAETIALGRHDGKASLKRRMFTSAMGSREKKTVFLKRKTRKPDGTTIEEQFPQEIDVATQPNTVMQIWLSKQMLGYKEQTENSNSNVEHKTVTHKYYMRSPKGDVEMPAPVDMTVDDFRFDQDES